MKSLLASIVIFFSFSTTAQESINQNYLDQNYKREASILKTVLDLTKRSQYVRAEAINNELKMILTCREKANKEEYSVAYKLSDSIFKLRRIVEAKKIIFADKVNTFKQLETDINRVFVLLSNGKLQQSIGRLGALSIQLNSAYQSSSLNSGALTNYLTTNASQLNSDSISILKNQNRIVDIEAELEKPEIQNNWDPKSILNHELKLRKDIRFFIRSDRYLSSEMDYEKLSNYIKNPWPFPNPADAKKQEKAPETRNQKKLVELEKEIYRRRRANIHVGTWQIQKEIEHRQEIEKVTKLGNEARIAELKEMIKDLQSGF